MCLNIHQKIILRHTPEYEGEEMDKYTVLLVDDEEEVIQVIMKKLDWEQLGFSIVGYACNGVKAFEMVEDYQPDVVMTDIKMPYMNGMQLSHRIKTQYPDTKILIFTGFDEFEYAKEAVHLEVEEYILKPVNSLELSKVFTQLKSKLDLEISEKGESVRKSCLSSWRTTNCRSRGLSFAALSCIRRSARCRRG